MRCGLKKQKKKEKTKDKDEDKVKTPLPRAGRNKLARLLSGIIVPLISVIVVFYSNNGNTEILVPEGMVLIKGGCFEMGDTSGGGAYWEKPVHKVCVDDFYMGKYEVTQGQWKEIMGNDNPSHFQQGDDYPIESVSWNNVQEFIEKLNKQSGMNYRLPTESEWEYAARAGTMTKWYCGDYEGCLDDIAWSVINSGNKTNPVGQKQPNSWGLYDMAGNVWEWVEDDWHNTYTNAPNDGCAWIDEPRGPCRVIRGGAWDNGIAACRSSVRHGLDSSYTNISHGFRLALPQAIRN